MMAILGVGRFFQCVFLSGHKTCKFHRAHSVRLPLLAIQGEAFSSSNARRLACRKLNLSGGAKQQQPHKLTRQGCELQHVNGITARVQPKTKWRFCLCVSVPWPDIIGVVFGQYHLQLQDCATTKVAQWNDLAGL